jgi:hypothetical protein
MRREPINEVCMKTSRRSWLSAILSALAALFGPRTNAAAMTQPPHAGWLAADGTGERAWTYDQPLAIA